ncbi:sulfotransferase 2B1-like [Serinus canaria]|uniref:sulfotransferase 2B1-like n=1 Tax=Serinus canaria TaxID=9135 RepID=UPI0021CC949A|nr:sulfotransferase 2B1-like [Serinus canaria]
MAPARIPGSPAGMCRGVPAPRPPGPLPLSALFKRLPARPARPGHGALGGDRDLCGHRPARPPPHPGVPRLRRRLHLPPHRRAHRHLPQIGANPCLPYSAMMCRATPWCHGPALTPTSAGTTWMQEILTLLFSLGDARPAKTIPNWERAPWLEQIYSREALRNTGSPRLLTTHLPARVLAPALQRSKAKVIYVARNPKDVAVSFYHFHHLAKFLPDPSSFDAFLTQFLEGTVHYGSWFDHVKGWLGQRHLLDILYVTYEELHQDLRGTAQRLSSFLGCPLAPGTLAALEQHCSFSAMRDNAMANYSLIPAEIMDHSQGRFMRKGVVGDWRSHFSPEQNALFNRRYQEEMGDTELPSQWPMA